METLRLSFYLCRTADKWGRSKGADELSLRGILYENMVVDDEAKQKQVQTTGMNFTKCTF
jgi:hypothetical protein